MGDMSPSWLCCCRWQQFISTSLIGLIASCFSGRRANRKRMYNLDSLCDSRKWMKVGNIRFCCHCVHIYIITIIIIIIIFFCMTTTYHGIVITNRLSSNILAHSRSSFLPLTSSSSRPPPSSSSSSFWSPNAGRVALWCLVERWRHQRWPRCYGKIGAQ